MSSAPPRMTGGSVSAAVGYPIEFLHALAPIAGALIGLFASWRMLTGPAATPAVEIAP